MDKYSHHEALDRTHIQLTQLEGALGEHPVIASNKDARDLYEQAVRSLGDLYQLLGRGV